MNKYTFIFDDLVVFIAYCTNEKAAKPDFNKKRRGYTYSSIEELKL